LGISINFRQHTASNDNDTPYKYATNFYGTYHIPKASQVPVSAQVSKASRVSKTVSQVSKSVSQVSKTVESPRLNGS